MPNEQTITTFAARLDDYANGLPEREREILMAMLIQAMDPLERMRWRDSSNVLTSNDEEMIKTLANKHRQG